MNCFPQQLYHRSLYNIQALCSLWGRNCKQALCSVFGQNCMFLLFKRAVINRHINYADIIVDICYALGSNTNAMFAWCIVGGVERRLIPLQHSGCIWILLTRCIYVSRRTCEIKMYSLTRTALNILRPKWPVTVSSFAYWITLSVLFRQVSQLKMWPRNCSK